MHRPPPTFTASQLDFHSLWTGDLGFAIFLWDYLRAEARFPTLEVFYADGADTDGPFTRRRAPSPAS
jgi:hypothetical protein